MQGHIPECLDPTEVLGGHVTCPAPEGYAGEPLCYSISTLLKPWNLEVLKHHLITCIEEQRHLALITPNSPYRGHLRIDPWVQTLEVHRRALAYGILDFAIRTTPRITLDERGIQLLMDTVTVFLTRIEVVMYERSRV